MTTARDLCLGALRDAGVLGVGQTASSEDLNDAMLKLNRMLAQWAARRWLVYGLQDVGFVSTGAVSYSIGPGGTINLPNRPARVDSVFVRMYAGTPNAIDYSLSQISSREDYNNIGLKSLASMPAAYFYDNASPLANLYIWPIPSALYEIHASLYQPIGQMSDPSSALSLAIEYEEPVHYNLVVRLRQAYGRPPDEVATALAQAGMATLRSINSGVPELQMPIAVLPRGPAAGAPYYPALPY